jgi:hypothetical protein
LEDHLTDDKTDNNNNEIYSLIHSLIKTTLSSFSSSHPSSSSSHDSSSTDAKKLEASVSMTQDLLDSNETAYDLHGMPVKRGDIRHVNSKAGPAISTVDQKKLRKAELKLASKRAERGAKADQYEIPVWNPNVKPTMLVNQMKVASVSTESKSKDIRIENFGMYTQLCSVPFKKKARLHPF